MKKLPGSIILLLSLIYMSGITHAQTLAWAKQLGGNSGHDIACSITSDINGNVYSTGYFAGTADFDPGASVFNLTSNGLEDIFISKLNASGNFVWAKKIGGVNADVAG